MDIKVKVGILHRKTGDIVREGDKDYETFVYWAERKDRKFGMVICEFVQGQDERSIQKDGSEEHPEDDGDVLLICECGFISHSESGMKIHKAKKHPKQEMV